MISTSMLKNTYDLGSDSIDIYSNVTAWRKFRSSKHFAFIPLLAAVACMVVPGSFVVLVPIVGLWTWLNYRSNVFLPLRAPMAGKQKWSKDVDATGTQLGNIGISYLGICQETKRQIWSDSGLDRTHRLVIGTTGSGKTVTITSLITAVSFISGGGLSVYDGKGDKDFVYTIMALTRRFLRQHDFFLLDFATSRDIYERSPKFISNQINLVTQGSSGVLSEIVKGMGAGDSKGGDDIWKQRADMWTDLSFRLLYYFQDRHGEVGTLSGFASYLDLKYFISRFLDNRIVQDPAGRIPLSMATDFLTTLPGIDMSELDKINSGESKISTTTSDQWGYVVMSVAPALSLMSRAYWHIFDTRSLADIDFEDAFLGDRILFGLLPALQKSDSALRSIGKLLVGLTQAMYGKVMPDALEGGYANLKELRATQSAYYYQVIYDEGGYYLASGSDKQQAQLRSLGVSVTVCAQNYGQLEKSGEDVAEGIWGSSNLKFFGKVEDSGKTLDQIQKRTGKREHWVANERKVEMSEMGGKYYSGADTVKLQERDAVQVSDMSALGEGDFLFIVGRDTYKIKSPYFPPPKIAWFKPNVYMSMEVPKVERESADLLAFKKQLKNHISGKGGAGVLSMKESESALDDIVAFVSASDNPNMMERGLSALSVCSDKILQSSLSQIDMAGLENTFSSDSSSDIFDQLDEDFDAEDSGDGEGDGSPKHELVPEPVKSEDESNGLVKVDGMYVYDVNSDESYENWMDRVEQAEAQRDGEDDSIDGNAMAPQKLSANILDDPADDEEFTAAGLDIDELSGGTEDPLIMSAKIAGTESEVRALVEKEEEAPNGLIPDKAISVVERLAKQLCGEITEDEFDYKNLP